MIKYDKLSFEDLQAAFGIVYAGPTKANILNFEPRTRGKKRTARCKNCGNVVKFKKTRKKCMATMQCPDCLKYGMFRKVKEVK